MKKQFHKIKIAAENLSRSSKSEIKSDELVKVEKQVEKCKDVIEKIHKKFSPSANSEIDREKRIKKIHEFRLAQLLEESYRELSEDLILHKILKKCGDLEKTIANFIVDSEIQAENEVTKKLKGILDDDIQQIALHKRVVTKYVQDYNYVKRSFENAQKLNENAVKLNHIKLEQEECEAKLEKERDCWAAEMFALIAKDEDIACCVKDFVICQKTFYEKALRNTEICLDEINNIINTCDKKRIFGISLKEHLRSSKRKISKVIEFCVCCLMEKGLSEEGLLRVGCSGMKLKRLKNAFDAQFVYTPLPPEYQDVHVIAGLLKLYLRELPEPLLTYDLYENFIQAAQTEEKERKNAILNAINQLPFENYENLKYLANFLWCLCQKQNQNKMSSQNIAIVISPNILWPPNNSTDTSDYIGQVNSTAAVNTIVELLVSEYGFFFDSEVDFFQTISRDNIFISTGSQSTTIYSTEKEVLPVLESVAKQPGKPGHSRNNSHDASLIFMGSNDSCSLPRSQSNGSLSDNSSQTYPESPRLPARRKHNKPSAPTPPNKTKLSSNTESRGQKMTAGIETTDDDISVVTPLASGTQQTQKCDGFSQTPAVINATSLHVISKPEKPPRPAPVECSTLNRSTYKNRSAEKLSWTNRPIAMPRTSLNAAKSTENITIEDQSVNLRNKSDAREKPAIPERPSTLVRPLSFKNDPQKQFNSDGSINIEANNNSLLKKASSFRSTTGSNLLNSKSPNNSSNGNSASNSNNVAIVSGYNSKTTLERAQFYNVDKKQVAIVDVQTGTDQPLSTLTATPNKKKEFFKEDSSEIEILYHDNTMCDVSTQNEQISPLPRAYDAKIKRPQVPAPPPPTSRPKLENDSTHL